MCNPYFADPLAQVKESCALITIATIQAACCAHYGVGLADLCSERQGRTIAPPRHVAMWLCKRLTRHSVAMIGQKFGYRDHSSVYHAIRLTDRRIAAGKCPEIWGLLAELQRPHATAWPQIAVAHSWVRAAISAGRAAA